MKKDAPDLRREAVAVKDDSGWVIKLQTAVMGIVPIGPRLARGTTLPDIPKTAETSMEAQQLVERWNHWFSQFPNQLIRPKRKKRI